MNTIYIYKGTVTTLDAHVDCYIGQTEYQFSNGVEGERAYSADYINLEEGLLEHSGYIIHFK